uniref:Orn_Arg_deC_N domain-containing protein n=1 Tax=Elaeophora elaphi TaxID=1147741 RepID=A0A0R3RLF5_9BILA
MNTLSTKSLRPRSRYAAGFERVWTLILAWKPEKTLKISPEEHTDGSSPPSNRIPQSVIRELCIALLSSDPIPRPGSTQIKLDSDTKSQKALSIFGFYQSGCVLLEYFKIFSLHYAYQIVHPSVSASLPPEKPCHWTEVVKRRTFCVHPFHRIVAMAPVHSLDIYDNYNCNKAYRSASVVKQCDLNAVYGDDCFDTVRKLIAAKVAKGDYDPFFVMNAELIDGVLKNWFKKMPDVKPYYVLRCNSNDVLLKLLTRNTDMGVCCSNRYEVEMAMKIVNVDRIIYRNPLWTRGSIRHAKECGIQTVIIETEDDLKRFAMYYPEASIILRVTMDRKVVSDPLTEDNLDVQKASSLLRTTKDSSVRIRGVSLSVRPVCPTPTMYSYAVAQCRRLFDIGLEVGHEMDILDVGDGFPSMFATDGLSFDQIAESIHAAFALFFPPKFFKNIKMIAEPGAYFAASSFSLITRVVDKRLIDGSFLTNDEADAGAVGYIYQINEGFYGAFGCKLLTHRNPICSPLMIFGEKISTYAAVIGPEACDTDVVLSLTRLPPLQIGDWLVWHDMGAYTIGNHDTSERNNPPLVIHYYYEKEKTK